MYYEIAQFCHLSFMWHRGLMRYDFSNAANVGFEQQDASQCHLRRSFGWE